MVAGTTVSESSERGVRAWPQSQKLMNFGFAAWSLSQKFDELGERGVKKLGLVDSHRIIHSSRQLSSF